MKKQEPSFFVVSAFTPDTVYEEQVKVLIKSLHKVGLKNYYHIYTIENRGSWHRNTQQKVDVLLKAIDDFYDSNIVWLDADATVHQYPSYFDRCIDDIALRPNFKNFKREDVRGLMAGTLFLRNCDDVRFFLRHWKAENERLDSTDQASLYETFTDRKFEHMCFGALPVSYTIIPSDPATKRYDPVITHGQISHRAKRVDFGKSTKHK
jgi:hypothetical protein